MEIRKVRLKEFENGIQRFSSRLEKLERKSSKFSIYRLTIFLTGLILFLFSFFFLSMLFVWISIAVLLIVFGIVSGVHNKIDEGIKKCKLWLEIKKENLARMNIDWKNIPYKNSGELNREHPFGSDLEITGKNSLHQLIDVSTSNEGSKKLKEWLLTKISSEDIILERQKIVKELIPLQHFRNKLILNSNLATQKRLEGTKLSAWLNSGSNIKKLKKLLTTLTFIIPINILLVILFVLKLLPAYWVIGALIYVGIYWFNSKYISELFEKSLDIEMEFGKFSRILEFLEKYNYSQNKLLRTLCKTFFENKRSPSYYFKRLSRITTAVSFQKNPFTMLLLNIIFPYDFFFAYKLEKVKKDMTDRLPDWLETFYNLEALISLSNFAYINPDYVFPSIQKGNPDNLFLAEKITHPFIPFDVSIPNDFSISTKGEVVIITGSNMSGKSTFLKSIGINLALCFAGGVVCASRFQTKLYKIYTCINISDSVTDGISYFYAEVKRLKNLLNEIKAENSLPVFYLIDEIFRGTNNLERLIGSRSYIKSLAGLNGTGLISTHDLELIKLEKEISKVNNYHFKEDISNGKMIFDYKLRRGPSPTTNALKIMKIEGLPVEKEF
jgi:ABC-type multidrug transport system fused ATPase/permease subunit